MPWSTAVRKDLQDITTFLEKEERDHVFLSSYFFNGGNPAFPPRTSGKTLIHKKNDRVNAVIFLSLTGIMLPAFEPGEIKAEEWSALRRYLYNSSRRIFSLLGREDRVQRIEKLLPYEASERVAFQLLSRDKDSAEKKIELPPGHSIHKASKSDINHLFPLEEAYQLEEVYVGAGKLDTAWLKIHFGKQLREQNILYIDFGGRAVAKAGTNAIGKNYAQFGGIFTHPDFRNKGLGTMLVEQLHQWQKSQGRHSCLFVKTSNKAALQVYQKTGFIPRSPFRISYFRD